MDVASTTRTLRELFFGSQFYGFFDIAGSIMKAAICSGSNWAMRSGVSWSSSGTRWKAAFRSTKDTSANPSSCWRCTKVWSCSASTSFYASSRWPPWRYCKSASSSSARVGQRARAAQASAASDRSSPWGRTPPALAQEAAGSTAISLRSKTRTLRPCRAT